MKIIKDREYVDGTYWVRNFWYKSHPGSWGFGFDCTKDGKLLKMNPDAQRNYEACLTGFVDGQAVYDDGIQEIKTGYWSPAIGICEACKRKVTLEGFTCSCEYCGADYNSGGQRLAPREQWGEETGEHPSDILRIP